MVAKPKTTTQPTQTTQGRPAATGEPQRRAGRPPRHGAISSERVTLRLTHDEVMRLRELGNGEVTEGVRRLLASDKMSKASDTMPPAAATPAPKRDLSGITAPPRPSTPLPATSASPVTPRPQLPRPVLPPPAASDSLYRAVRAVPKSYSTRDDRPKSASPRPHTPAGASATPHADQGDDRPWWEQ